MVCFLFFLNTSILKCMFSCLFSHFFFFEWFFYVLTVEFDEITADIYTQISLLFCVMGLYMHSHLYMEIYECLYHCKEFFWCSSNHTVQVYTQHKNRFLFFSSLLLILPYKQYFTFKVLSLCKTVKPHRFLCSFAIPFKFSAVLFPVPHNQDYLTITSFSCFLLLLFPP